MAPSSLLPLLLLLLLTDLTPTTTTTTTTATTTTADIINSLCSSTPYPSSCLTSLKISINIPLNIPPLLSFLLHSLSTAVSSSVSLLPLLSSSHITEHQKGSLQDCHDLHSSTIALLQKSSRLVQTSSLSNRRLSDVRTYLSAALTNKNTCLEGLENASGEGKQQVVAALLEAYRHVSNSLSIVSKPGAVGPNGRKRRRRLMGSVPEWVRKKDRRLLQTGDYGGYDPSSVSSSLLG